VPYGHNVLMSKFLRLSPLAITKQRLI